MDTIYYCPHCKDPVVIKSNDINCGIFRHAVYKGTFEGIPPHSKKEDCDRLISQGLVYGCGKPFRISKNDTVICDYI